MTAKSECRRGKSESRLMTSRELDDIADNIMKSWKYRLFGRGSWRAAQFLQASILMDRHEDLVKRLDRIERKIVE